MTFLDRLLAAGRRNRSLLCVGLDPDGRKLPTVVRAAADPTYTFCMAIVEATADLVCAFKPNIAFFEALGPTGIETLRRLIADMPRDVPVILDAKRGDMGSTAEAYAEALFERLGADAVTLNPYLGGDSLAPFLRHTDKGCIVLCKTSNPGSAELQELQLASGIPLYMEVARRARDDWNGNANVGLVVGATYPQVLAQVRALCPDLALLVPGVGAQGGELAAATRAAADSSGERAIISASRSVLYAGDGADFAEAARQEALRLREAINAAIVQRI
ncbi:MAG TPA: orotidine-5'-phosphate decarboxylase [Roseiflexaceae bacterium]|nr:orotidine-5'-phosphate decarboxylase [Roseiflexaceae bacterium]